MKLAPSWRYREAVPGINNCTCTQNHLRASLVGPLYQLSENLVSEVTTVSKLENTYATLVTSLDDVLADFNILIEENRYPYQSLS